MPLVNRSFSDIITFTRASGGGRFNAQGQYEWLAADQPRIDYDPVTGEAKGLLIEEQRTNLLTYSSDFADRSWNKTNGSYVTPNVGAGLDGLLSASRWKRVATSPSFISKAYNKAQESSAYTLTVFARKDEGDYLALRLQGNYPGRADAVFNLATGAIHGTVSAVSGFSAPSAKIESLGAIGYKISLTATSDAAPQVQCYISFNSSGGVVDATDTNAGSSGLLMGAQLEQASSPSSYIPTTTAQVTRAADVASVNVLSPWYRADEGALVIEAFSAPGTGSPALNVGAALSGGNDYMYALLKNNSGVYRSLTVRKDGAEVVALAHANVGFGLVKGAFSYTKDNFAGVLNAGVVLTDTSGGVPVVSSLQIGRLVGGFYWNGHIRSIRYFPKRLSNAELQSLTAN